LFSLILPAMTRLASSTLSNCYVPLTVSVENKTLEERQAHLIASRSNGDGQSRGPDALRRLCLETSILSNASGSALVELGHTKVLCRVEGPITATDSFSNTNMDEGVLQCIVKYIPIVGINPQSSVGNTATTLDSQHASMGRINSATMTLEADLSSNLHAALLPSVPLEQFPKCLLTVNVVILQDDGSALSACIVASSLALADANVELYDLVSSCAVAVLGSQIVADPTEEELAAADASVVLAILPSWKDVTLWQQLGKLSREQASQAVDLCQDGCRTLQRFMRQCLVESVNKNKR
jgi:exosome complex component MTR3